ncbi:MAG: hypothetical protein QOE30_3135 [Mycobacterium sp.]|jgi:hypothetical protein|nr:hypothetical protein [Mycobacterium sp.]
MPSGHETHPLSVTPRYRHEFLNDLPDERHSNEIANVNLDDLDWDRPHRDGEPQQPPAMGTPSCRAASAAALSPGPPTTRAREHREAGAE